VLTVFCCGESGVFARQTGRFWLVKEPLLDCKTIGFAKH